MKYNKVLILNKFYFPIGVETIEKTFSNIFSGSVFPLDIEYEVSDDGVVNFEKVETFTAVKSTKEWLNLEIRAYDEYIQTIKGPVRIPQVVICANYDKIVYNKIQFPTKHNVFKRDNYTCVYSGRKLSKDEISIDHVIPRSKGGQDTWENLVTCCKKINIQKGNKLLHETPLKLKYKPYKPKNGMTFDLYKEEWSSFLKSL